MITVWVRWMTGIVAPVHANRDHGVRPRDVRVAVLSRCRYGAHRGILNNALAIHKREEPVWSPLPAPGDRRVVPSVQCPKAWVAAIT